MIYLLDVNVLIGLTHKDSVFHLRTSNWLRQLDKTQDSIAFCALTELSVVRILPQLPEGDYTVADGQQLLAGLKSALKLTVHFLADDIDAQSLPRWVKVSKQTTDGHLIALANRYGAKLATLDRAIPGSFVLPG